MKYIRQKRTKGCIFCRIFRERKDKKNFILLRSSHCFTVFNTFPYTNGHVMIVANRHAGSLESLADAELLDLNRTLIKMKVLLEKTLRPGGFNVGLNLGKLAGAGVDKHIHFHLVPRWIGDTNFMPIVAGTKVIPQSLGELYNKLKRKLK